MQWGLRSQLREEKKKGMSKAEKAMKGNKIFGYSTRTKLIATLDQWSFGIKI